MKIYYWWLRYLKSVIHFILKCYDFIVKYLIKWKLIPSGITKMGDFIHMTQNLILIFSFTVLSTIKSYLYIFVIMLNALSIRHIFILFITVNKSLYGTVPFFATPIFAILHLHFLQSAATLSYFRLNDTPLRPYFTLTTFVVF